MAGLTVDPWHCTFTVRAGEHEVVVTEESDGVNDPEVSATVDGRPVPVQVGGVVLVDGLHEVPFEPRDRKGSG
jgi:hypothetical protein